MKGFPYSCAAAASFGLESLVRGEVEALGIRGVRVEDRRVCFDATAAEIARCNLWLRTADRLFVTLAEFPSPGFDALYDGVRRAPWRDWLVPEAEVVVEASSVKSRLTALPSLQSVTKKAIVDAVSPSARMPENGPRYDVHVELRNDVAAVSLDTTGPGLHKRGYRRHTGDAPLRENLAAAMVMLSRWDPSRPLADPVCGSGTIAIEAALLAARIAPGARRTFAAESWPTFPASAWKEERASAADAEVHGLDVRITGSDRDAAVLRAAHANAKSAGVADLVTFRRSEAASFSPEGDYGCVVCNPPYGERLGNEVEARELAADLGKLHRSLPTWSFFVLSAREDFPRFFGARATKNRKLYNGNLRCWLYQYFGPLP